MNKLLLRKVGAMLSCLVLFFRSSKRKQQIICDVLLLDWGISFIEFISVFGEFKSLFAHIIQATIMLIISIDMILFLISIFPEIFGIYFRLRRGDLIIPLPAIEESLLLYVTIKSSIVTPILFTYANSLDQQLLSYIKLLSSFHLILVMQPSNSLESMIDSLKGKFVYIIPLSISLIVIICIHLIEINFVTNFKEISYKDLKIKYLELVSVSLLLIFGSLSWMKIIEAYDTKKNFDSSKNWLHNLNHFHLSVIGIRQDFSIMYANKTAKDYFAPLTKEHFKNFCNQLTETDVNDELQQKVTLTNHLEYLFTLLESISNSKITDKPERQHICKLIIKVSYIVY